MSINRAGDNGAPIPRNDVARIVQDSRYVEDRLVRNEGLPFGYVYQSAPATSAIVSVNITGPLSMEYYEGTCQFLNPLSAVPYPPSWYNPTDVNGSQIRCRVRVLNDGDVLEEGRRYHGKTEGWIPNALGLVDFPDELVVSVDPGDATINVGCGLLERTHAGVVYVEVDYVQVAGNNVVTSLIGVATNTNTNTCGYLKFDKTPTSNTNEVLVTDVTMAMHNGSLRLSVTKQTYRNFFNAAGVHVDRQEVANTLVTTNTDINTCLFETCCNTTGSVTATATADPTDINPGESVDFTGAAAGGTPPYSYFWDFDDGATSTAQNPSHVFAAAGTYNVVLTVTDACGWSNSDIVTITVHPPVDNACCDDVPGVLAWAITNRTGDCVCIATLTGRVVYNGGTSQWEFVDFACPLTECEENASQPLACVAGVWVYSGINPTTEACAPFELVFDKVSPYDPGGGYTITFSVP